MWNRTIVFLGVALLAGMLGFVGITGWAAEISKIASVIFLALFLEGLSSEQVDTASRADPKGGIK